MALCSKTRVVQKIENTVEPTPSRIWSIARKRWLTQEVILCRLRRRRVWWLNAGDRATEHPRRISTERGLGQDRAYMTWHWSSTCLAWRHSSAAQHFSRCNNRSITELLHRHRRREYTATAMPAVPIKMLVRASGRYTDYVNFRPLRAAIFLTEPCSADKTFRQATRKNKAV